jgi:uncharacterized protein YecE (DUF72 family)
VSPKRKSRKTIRSTNGALRVGTSGWHYDHWWGPFYPPDVRKKNALLYYASRFDCAELNAPFYRTPTPAAVRGWFDQTPKHFRFAWKASKFITHWKRLSERSRNSLDLLEDRLALLGDKAGPILFQLPPRMHADCDRLAGFVKLLERSRKYTFEFRHPSWYDRRVLGILQDHDMSLCFSDHADAPAPCEPTAGWIYIRYHGPSGRYHGSYTDAFLSRWARRIDGWLTEGRDVWCFFDNDVKSAAPRDALRLIEAVETADWL